MARRALRSRKARSAENVARCRACSNHGSDCTGTNGIPNACARRVCKMTWTSRANREEL